MPAITQKQMELLIDHFCKMWVQLPTVKQKNLLIQDLNEVMTSVFDNAKANGYMFGFQKYDCQIVGDTFRNKMKVQFHRRWKPKYKKGQPNSWTLEYSHEIPLSRFCYDNCNPSIIHIIEKLLFQRL